MSKATKATKVAGIPGTDPTLPRVEIKLNGKSYFLCFNFRALATAQKTLRDNGIDCNLLHSLDLSGLQADRLVPLLYSALITYKPDITLEEVFELVTFKNLGTVFEGIAQAYGASLAEPSPEDAKADPNQAE